MKTKLLLLVISALLVGVGLVGCGPKNDTTQTPVTTPAPSETTAAKTAPSVVSPVWPDIPIYPSLTTIQRTSQPLPMATGYANAEFRVYETNDSLEKVVSFYKDRMAANGWEEFPWTDTPQISMGSYSKNNLEHMAWVWVVSVEGKTQVILGRASKE
ncbi:MAG: hypothetical protein Q7R50_03955 [Dehalococcoidales bacterium]|nr:hypothetical protein [Dehalococcoidales bacterium]